MTTEKRDELEQEIRRLRAAKGFLSIGDYCDLCEKYGIPEGHLHAIAYPPDDNRFMPSMGIPQIF